MSNYALKEKMINRFIIGTEEAAFRFINISFLQVIPGHQFIL
jgi:hypothetical protein